MTPLDSRRQTGAGYLLDGPGAALEVCVPEPLRADASAAWRRHARALCDALGWTDSALVVREFPRGLSLALSSPVDLLYTATEVNEAAWAAARAEIEGEMGDSLPGMQARLMSQALRKLTGSISRSKCMVIFINQIRMKIGVMFGSPETTTGGNALKFYASVRLDIRRIGAIKDRDEVTGNQTKVKVVKNKLAPPFKQVEFDIMYGEGVSKTGELVDLGVKSGIVEKSGAWFSYNSQRLGQGRENAKSFLRDNPAVADEIETLIRQNAGLLAEQLLDDTGPGDDSDA